ncbi:cation-translocating P-type ATPase [Simkania negevensis]|uniref:Cation-translocating P-type ATPase n=1 Tax=Simkania negevensis TaxID=83561 RepID=A0ABS3AS30_9BACT|nr:cation-translocating P-type ATPase [Simkania negevensis]
MYQILKTQGKLHNIEENALFQQAVKAGLISNPLLLEQMRQKRRTPEDGEVRKLHLEVGQMWCPSCAELIRLCTLQQRGVHNCVVDYTTDLASIEYLPREVSQETLYNLISRLGYEPKKLGDEEGRRVSVTLYVRFFIALFCAMNIMMFSYPIYLEFYGIATDGYARLFSFLSLLLSIPVVFFCGWPIFRRFFLSATVGMFGMETLVTLGVATAAILSVYNIVSGNNEVYFDSMAMIIVFVLLGKIIESKAKFSARSSLVRLARSRPKRGRVLRKDGRTEYRLTKEIKLGERLQIVTGEKVVMDGVVCDGEGSCDESVMTGEHFPVVKRRGDTVLAGTVVKQGAFVYEVTTTEEETALQRIIDLVEQEIGGKSTYMRPVDAVVRWFVPTVVLIALLTIAIHAIAGSGSQALLYGIAVLLISCPCAIGIAAPLAEALLMSGLAAHGAIVRNRGCLRYLGKETAFVFDKTGTVTEGSFEVLEGLATLSKEERGVLAALSYHSRHPISCAIAEALQAEELAQLDAVEEVVGKGMRGYYQGKEARLGSFSFLGKGEKSKAAREEASNTMVSGTPVTEVYFVCGAAQQHTLYLGDRIKEGVADVLHSMDDCKTWLISGDQKATVAAIATECRFGHWAADCSPLYKAQEINRLKKEGYVVGMLGDGINDAPALSTAHVAVSVVNATDVSIQVSDILLTTDKLAVLQKIRLLGKKGRCIVKQNLFWAFFYNAVGIPLASLGLLKPLYATAAMVLSSVVVILNARRLNKRG